MVASISDGWLDISLSDHFRLSEFMCKCKRSNKSCQRGVIVGALVDGLEIYRARFSASGLSIVSGFRCGPYNTSVGGASESQHPIGTAADIPGRATLAQCITLNCFSGLGVQRSSGLVVHVDVRHLGLHNTLGRDTKTPATPDNPAVWYYN